MSIRENLGLVTKTSHTVIRRHQRYTLWDMFMDGFPHPGLPSAIFWYRMRNFHRLLKPMFKIAIGKSVGLSHFCGRLYAEIIRADGSREYLGLISANLIVTAGKVYIAADFAAGANDINLFKFHGFGTGVVDPAISDTQLGTELTTEYSTDNVRPTGTQSTPGSTNLYRCVGLLTIVGGAGPFAITEHGLFTDVDRNEGTMLDRTEFAAINLMNGDSLNTTFDLTVG